VRPRSKLSISESGGRGGTGPSTFTTTLILIQGQGRKGKGQGRMEGQGKTEGQGKGQWKKFIWSTHSLLKVPVIVMFPHISMAFLKDSLIWVNWLILEFESFFNKND